MITLVKNIPQSKHPRKSHIYISERKRLHFPRCLAARMGIAAGQPWMVGFDQEYPDCLYLFPVQDQEKYKDFTLKVIKISNLTLTNVVPQLNINLPARYSFEDYHHPEYNLGLKLTRIPH